MSRLTHVDRELSLTSIMLTFQKGDEGKVREIRAIIAEGTANFQFCDGGGGGSESLPVKNPNSSCGIAKVKIDGIHGR